MRVIIVIRCSRLTTERLCECALCRVSCRG